MRGRGRGRRGGRGRGRSASGARGRGRSAGRAGRGGRGGRRGGAHSAPPRGTDSDAKDIAETQPKELDVDKNVKDFFVGNVSIEQHYKGQEQNRDRYAACIAVLEDSGVEIAQTHIREKNRKSTARTTAKHPRWEPIQDEHRDVEFGSNANHNTESEPMDHEYARSCEDQLPESGCSLSKRKCNKCGKWIGKVWFKRHMTLHDVSASKDINRQRHHATYIIDHAKGIFCSWKGLRGGGFIHIKKASSGPDCGTFCERSDCIQSYEVANRGRHMSYECPHVQSIQYAKPGIEEDQTPRSLQALITGKLITQVREHEALELQEEAKQQNTPFLVYMPLDGFAQRYIYLSVYSGQTRYWSRLKRTVVTIDKKDRCIYCQCSPEKMTCKHKIIGKWYLNQEHPEVLSSRIEERVGDDATDETDYTHEDYLYLSQKEYPPNGHVLERMTKYIMMCKKYPDDASRHALYNDFESRATIVPKETHCHFCHAQLRTWPKSFSARKS